jgi:hypothetical protein
MTSSLQPAGFEPENPCIRALCVCGCLGRREKCVFMSLLVEGRKSGNAGYCSRASQPQKRAKERMQRPPMSLREGAQAKRACVASGAQSQNLSSVIDSIQEQCRTRDRLSEPSPASPIFVVTLDVPTHPTGQEKRGEQARGVEESVCFAMVFYIPDGHVFLRGDLEEAPRLDGYTPILEAPAEGSGSNPGEDFSKSISNQFWQKGPASSPPPRLHGNAVVRERPEGAIIPDPVSRRRRRGKDIERPAHRVFSLNFETSADGRGPSGHHEIEGMAASASGPPRQSPPCSNGRPTPPGLGRQGEAGGSDHWQEAIEHQRGRERERERERERHRWGGSPWWDEESEGQDAFDDLGRQWNTAMEETVPQLHHRHRHHHHHHHYPPPPAETHLPTRMPPYSNSALFPGRGLDATTRDEEKGRRGRQQEHQLTSTAAATENRALAHIASDSDEWFEYTDVPLCTQRDEYTAGEASNGTCGGVQNKRTSGTSSWARMAGPGCASPPSGQGDIRSQGEGEEMKDDRRHHRQQSIPHVGMTGKKGIVRCQSVRHDSSWISASPSPPPPARGMSRQSPEMPTVSTPRNSSRRAESPFRNSTATSPPGVQGVIHPPPQPYTTLTI